MKRRVLKTATVAFRYLDSAAIVRLTLAKRPRAFIATPHGNVWLESTTEGPWLEIDLAEALNMIVASRCYRHDDRHPLIAKLNKLASEVRS